MMSLCSAFHRFPERSSLLKAPNTSVASLHCGRSTVTSAKVYRKLLRKDIGSPKDAWLDQMLRALGSSLMAAVISTTTFAGTVSLAQMHNNQQGADLFKKACIGCHYEGGNVLQPGATLTKADLERNGVATTENIFNITYYGKGRMPGFGEKCTPKGQCTFGPRLSDEDIWLLAEFVKLQADQGWPKLERQRRPCGPLEADFLNGAPKFHHIEANCCGLLENASEDMKDAFAHPKVIFFDYIVRVKLNRAIDFPRVD